MLPEDDADLSLTVGFMEAVDDKSQIRALGPAGDRPAVLRSFREIHIPEMNKWGERLMILVIDFDDENRMEEAQQAIPEHLRERVFALGCWTDPEHLKRTLGGSKLDDIGSDLAQDCRDGTDNTWGHELLQHNSAELARLRDRARAILFN